MVNVDFAFNGVLLAIIVGYYLIINIVLFCMMAIDKKAAIKDKRRIPEKKLFVVAALGGGVGGLFGMVLKRHKTRHLDFVFVFTLSAILHILIAFLLIGNFVFSF